MQSGGGGICRKVVESTNAITQMNHICPPPPLFALALATLAAGLLTVRGAPVTLTPDPGTTSWPVEMSAYAREGYDSNVYATNANGALADHGSATTTFGLRVAVSLPAPAGSPGNGLTLAYAPEQTRFSQSAAEDNTVHRLTLQSSGTAGDWSWLLDEAGTYVDGSHTSLIYLNGGTTGNFSAYTLALPRERRAQFQDRTKAWLRCDLGEFFLRAGGNVQAYDLRTVCSATTGYLNFVDRYDANAGFDAGWRLAKEIALTLGWRDGFQRQALVPGIVKLSSSNHYDRLLAGLEGQPVSWLVLSLVGGPDFRSYSAKAPTVTDLTPTCLYVEGSATATLGNTDSVILGLKQWRWVASTGKYTYDDKTVSLSWKHRITASLGLQLSGQAQQSAFIGCVRKDNLYSLGVQLQYALTQRWSLNADYSWQRGADEVEADPQAREFTRHTGGLSIKCSL